MEAKADPAAGAPTPAELVRALFKERASADDTQVTEFCFATACLKLGDGRSVELAIDAEPAYAKAIGLHFAMTLRGVLCEPDGCVELFEKKLSAALGEALRKSKTPIADAMDAHPALLSSKLRGVEAFARLADATAAALGEAKQIGQATPRQGKPAKPRRI